MPKEGVNELSALNVLLEAARKLNRSSVLEEVLITLVDTALRLTRAERGFVFLRRKTERRGQNSSEKQRAVAHSGSAL